MFWDDKRSVVIFLSTILFDAYDGTADSADGGSGGSDGGTESSIAEKLDAILQRFELTGRMKDFYDIYYLARTFDS
ncbi:MAG: nucleotidyl transferase AbiEii/AbiGii toxin family protein [Lachnospiraceae bacterium]|nr:nucleotidyl transferase AbiEii/AbiGii toxin family protein [Lachnospiraceae bacterium]